MLVETPAGKLLNDVTEPLRKEINALPASGLFNNAKLSKEEYARQLFKLWHIYDALERGLYEHREHPVIFNIYHPRVFSRASYLSYDICHHLETVTWQTDPHYVDFCNNFPPSIKAYCDRLDKLGSPNATDEEVTLLAAHAYVRYTRVLEDGQELKEHLIKNYELFDDGDGFAFFNFRTLDPKTGDRPAEGDEIAEIKTWLKENLDEAVPDSPSKKRALVSEAELAFKFNRQMLNSIDSSQTLENYPIQSTGFDTMHVTGKTATLSATAFLVVMLAFAAYHFGVANGAFSGQLGLEQIQALVHQFRNAIIKGSTSTSS